MTHNKYKSPILPDTLELAKIHLTVAPTRLESRETDREAAYQQSYYQQLSAVDVPISASSFPTQKDLNPCLYPRDLKP